MKKGRPKPPEGYASGGYAVGTACFTVVDKGRNKVIGSGTEDRKITVRMYYPVNREDAAGKKYAPIFSAAKKAALMKAYHIKDPGEETNYAEYCENVPIAPGVRFPLIMFSMGLDSYVEANTYLLCALASHGYIIASVGHAYEALENDYEDGSTDLFDKRIQKAMYTNMVSAVAAQLRRLKEKSGHREALEKFDEFQNKYTPFIIVRAGEWVKDMEKALEAVKERYAESIDLSRGIGASGHSLGGCTAYNLCRYNDEFSCGINIDGALFGEYPEKTMEKPFCQISCREYVNFETRPFLDTSADTYSVVFDDMKHIGFTDAIFFIPLRFIVGKLPPDEMFRHLVYSHKTFFGKYLKGEDIAFDGLPSDKVTYTKIVRN
ncbi:MAG: hypothetical protein K5876_02300 [Ruminiclostridium sp.]|nr:hypothetical protein [Ruminiclostridium sp.]